MKKNEDKKNSHRKRYAFTILFILFVVPGFWHPAHYKIGASGSHNDISEQDYLNDTIPWEGWLMNYLDAVLEVSDISGWNYTHRSGGSSVVVTSSIWTAAVYDIQAGLSCLSSSLFWITTERLQMTSFTTPLTIDKVMLYIKNPSGEKNKVSSCSTVMCTFPLDNIEYIQHGFCISFLFYFLVFLGNRITVRKYLKICNAIRTSIMAYTSNNNGISKYDGGLVCKQRWYKK